MSANSFFTSSPTMVLPPSNPDQYFTNNHYNDPTASNQTPNGFGAPFTPNGTSIPPTPNALAGRKRSRGDIYASEEVEESLEDGSVDTPVTESSTKPRGKPVFGPGMTLIYPEDPSYDACAESQSGTWVEEKSQRQQFQLSHMKRPSVSSRKSQRMDSRASAPDDLAQLVLPPQMREVTAEPLIDEATRVLGISWTRMDSTETLQISQAAYSKWIQNHYAGLKDVSIWFENSAIPGYLVQAQNTYNTQQEYYIFSNDLTEAKLVTTDPAQLVPRLNMLPALELAAPGGTIRAETDPITADQNEINDVTEAMAEDYAMHGGLLRGFCSAHEMETD